MGEGLCDLELVSIFRYDTKGMIHQRRNWEIGLHQNKTFFSVKDSVKRVKR